MRIISRNIRYFLQAKSSNVFQAGYRACLLKTLVPGSSEGLTKLETKENSNCEEDFFGINEGIKYDNETVVKDKSKVDLTEKYNFKPPSHSNHDVVYELPFGNVRFDDTAAKDNKVRRENERLNKNLNDVARNMKSNQPSDIFDISLMKTVAKENYYRKEVVGSDFVDEQYFGQIREFNHSIEPASTTTDTFNAIEMNSGTDFIDEHVFGPDIHKFKSTDYKIPEIVDSDAKELEKNETPAEAETYPRYEDPFAFDIRESKTSDIKIPREESKIHPNNNSEKSVNVVTSTKDSENEFTPNLFDEQYFTGGSSSQPQFVQEGKLDIHEDGVTSNIQTSTNDRTNYESLPGDFEIHPKNIQSIKPESKKDNLRLQKKTKSIPKVTSEDTQIKQPTKSAEIAKQKPETAFDYVKAMRAQKFVAKASENPSKWKDKTLPKKEGAQKTVLSIAKKAPNYSKLISPEVLTLLKSSIIYNHGDILAINKPYGMCCHGKETKKSNVLGLSNFMEDLAKYATESADGKLYLTHRLDRNTTGVLLLAKTPEMATILSDMFADHKIIKTYYALCKGVPSPPEGIIDIPICEGHVGKTYRMVLNPEIKDDKGSILKTPSSRARRAVTRYKVLQNHLGTSFLEVKPLTGYKHQIRVHLGFGLSCPVIGDHKYSYLTKMAPQKLQGDVLEALKVRQSKVRDLPMYLHASSIVIPEIYEGRNILITAKLPHHFTTALSSLKYRKL